VLLYVLLASKYLPTIGAALKFRVELFELFDEAMYEELLEDTSPVSEFTSLVEKEKLDLHMVQETVLNVHAALFLATPELPAEEEVARLHEHQNVLDDELDQVILDKIALSIIDEA
jgi:hypothetical protein